MILEGERAERYDLVTAAHLLILSFLPLRHVGSRRALTAFVDAASRCHLRPTDRDAVLIQVLTTLDPQTGGRLPSLVDRFLACRRNTPDGLRRFERCVEDVIRFQGIGDPYVQQAVAIIHEQYGDPELREAALAADVGLTPSRLCEHFKAQTGVKVTEYLRSVRLDHAARLLMASHKSVKEISWAVGFRDAGNFDSDFKARFEMTPTEYRRRGILAAPAGARTVAPGPDVHNTSPARPAASLTRARAWRVLIVDDHQSTRETLGSYLRRHGYVIDLATSGGEALERALATRPHVMVLDVHLPDINGFTCLRELRRRCPGDRPAVLLFSADLDVEEQSDDARTLGAAVVSKLCDLEELERVIASLCVMLTH